MISDAELREEVEAELSSNSAIDGQEIGVTACNGLVTLTGYVRTFRERWEAEKSVKRLHGIKGIANDIEVRLGGAGERTDPEIAQAALSGLRRNTAVPDERIKLIVRDGWLTLEGEVEHYHQKVAAESAVRDLAGVRGVSDNITVVPPVSHPVDAMALKTRIEAAFRRNALLDTRGISVAAAGDDVILRGQVHSYAEFEEAATAAWTTPGVGYVSNQLTIAS